MAIKSRGYINTKLIHHSDRGLQYCSNEYQKLINKNNLNCSMTESYDPYQNAVAERINGILKQEFLFNTMSIDLKSMKTLVKQSIEIYNNDRPHWSNHMLTPNQMHKQKRIKIKTYKNKKSQKVEAF